MNSLIKCFSNLVVRSRIPQPLYKTPLSTNYQHILQMPYSLKPRPVNKYKVRYVRPDNPKIICRWIPMPDGNFIRKKSGTKPKHGKHVRGWKKRRSNRLVLANPSQRRLLRKLVPHYKTTRRTYGGVDVYREWGHLVKP